jgi:hypothetical protein
MSFYRLLFFAESPDTPWPSDAGEYTAFAASVATERCIDLTTPPLSQFRSIWVHFTDYTATQELAGRAREVEIDVIRYESVRDPKSLANLALLTCSAFSDSQPVNRQTWHIRLSGSGIQAICDFPRMRLAFDRNAFAADPRLKNFNWDRN